MEISVKGGKKESTGTRSWVCQGAISAGFCGIFGVKVERPCYVDGEKDGW